MPIFKGNKETLGYTPLFENWICCLCFKDLEENDLYIDEEGIKWDVHQKCELKDQIKFIYYILRDYFKLKLRYNLL